MSATVLLVATRDPRGMLNGRKMVLNTIISSFNGLGWDVVVAFFGKPATTGAAVDGDNVYIGLPMPGAVELLWNAAAGFGTGRRSLNEALYMSRAAMRMIRDVAEKYRCSAVVTDMVRTADYGRSLGLPWLADLDDLLSNRYANMARRGADGVGLLGHYESKLASLLARMAAPATAAILRREASIIARREIQVAREADAASVVSAVEAKELARRAGVPVTAIPMAVSTPQRPPCLAHRTRELVFLGGCEYAPNRTGVVDFVQRLAPRLGELGLADVHLDIIGSANGWRRENLGEAVNLVGYVEDLDPTLQGYRAMLVPSLPPGGVKTKLLHAAANGTLILADRETIRSTGLEAGTTALTFGSPEELMDLILRIRSGDPALEQITENARRFVRQFSSRSVRDLWERQIYSAFRLARAQPVVVLKGASVQTAAA